MDLGPQLTTSAVMGCIMTDTLEFNCTISCHQVLNTVNVVIFKGGGNFAKKYWTFHVGVIFMILLRFPSYGFYFRSGEFLRRRQYREKRKCYHIHVKSPSLGGRLPLFDPISLLNIHLPPRIGNLPLFEPHFLPIIFSLKE